MSVVLESFPRRRVCVRRILASKPRGNSTGGNATCAEDAECKRSAGPTAVNTSAPTAVPLIGTPARRDYQSDEETTPRVGAPSPSQWSGTTPRSACRRQGCGRSSPGTPCEHTDSSFRHRAAFDDTAMEVRAHWYCRHPQHHQRDGILTSVLEASPRRASSMPAGNRWRALYDEAAVLDTRRQEMCAAALMERLNKEEEELRALPSVHSGRALTADTIQRLSSPMSPTQRHRHKSRTPPTPHRNMLSRTGSSTSPLNDGDALLSPTSDA